MTENGPSSRGSAPRNTQFYGTMQKRGAKLVVIRGDAEAGESFSLEGNSHVVGRSRAALTFTSDSCLSPSHANFFYRDNALWVADQNSINGVFVRINEPAKIAFHQKFIVGEQLLELRSSDCHPFKHQDGTVFFGSFKRNITFLLAQRLFGGEEGIVYAAQSNTISVGREGCSLNFPKDRFLSNTHADIQFADNEFTLRDLNSKNGTFVKITKETPLQHGDYVFLGQQLLRVEIV